MFNNKFGLLAFAVGMLFINGVLLIPGLHGLFQIDEGLTGTVFAIVHGLSFASMVLVQIIKGLLWIIAGKSKKTFLQVVKNLTNRKK